YFRDSLSRERAEEKFASIVGRLEEFEYKNEGLTSLTTSGQIEESELEERFVYLMGLWAKTEKGVLWEKKRRNNIINYRFYLQKGDVEAEYWIRPQRKLGPKEEIEYSNRTNCLIKCS